MSFALQGTDCTLYAYTAYGTETNYGAGASTNILGQWKDIEVNVSNTWNDRTPNNTARAEKRFSKSDWKATLSNQIRSYGATGLTLALNTRLVQVIYTESGSGITVQMWGGISGDKYKMSRDDSEDTLELENVGDYIGPGGLSIVYG